MMNKKSTRYEPNESPSRWTESTQALQVRRQGPHLNAIPRNARINGDVSNSHRRRHPKEANQRRHRRQFLPHCQHNPRHRPDHTGGDEVGSPPVPHDRERVGEDPPEGFEDPRDEVDSDEELDEGRLELLHVFPVVVCDDAEEGSGEALLKAVDEEDAEDEGWVELGGEGVEPLEGLGYGWNKVVGFLLFCCCWWWYGIGRCVVF